MVLANFKSGRQPIMCATDVAARGLDVPNVGAVINYDFPNGVEVCCTGAEAGDNAL